ncbi:hypothetical protein DMUE_2137 [Dictyocoela muelleri]|nr:hypothetical protein DMUE_2137 [Dictyocoela muelleri]
MLDKLKKLRAKGFLSDPQISDKGHGSLIPTDYYTKAHITKKRADSTFLIDRKQGIKIYLESIFLYIKGSLSLNNKKTQTKSWRNISHFAGEIKKHLKKEENFFVCVLEYIIFILRFHSMRIEMSYKKENDLQWYDDWNDMYRAYECSFLEDFVLVKVEDLEDFVRKRLKIVI